MSSTPLSPATASTGAGLVREASKLGRKGARVIDRLSGLTSAVRSLGNGRIDAPEGLQTVEEEASDDGAPVGTGKATGDDSSSFYDIEPGTEDAAWFLEMQYGVPGSPEPPSESAAAATIAAPAAVLPAPPTAARSVAFNGTKWELGSPPPFGYASMGDGPRRLPKRGERPVTRGKWYKEAVSSLARALSPKASPRAAVSPSVAFRLSPAMPSQPGTLDGPLRPAGPLALPDPPTRAVVLSPRPSPPSDVRASIVSTTAGHMDMLQALSMSPPLDNAGLLDSDRQDSGATIQSAAPLTPCPSMARMNGNAEDADVAGQGQSSASLVEARRRRRFAITGAQDLVARGDSLDIQLLRHVPSPTQQATWVDDTRIYTKASSRPPRHISLSAAAARMQESQGADVEGRSDDKTSRPSSPPSSLANPSASNPSSSLAPAARERYPFANGGLFN